jgi:hypothetical protein
VPHGWCPGAAAGPDPDDLCDWERMCALLTDAEPWWPPAVNLRTNRHVVVTTGCNSWDRGLDVVVEGEATRETGNGVLAELARAWSAKWDGRWDYEARDGAFHHPGGGEALVFRVTPRKVLAFGKGAFTHTSYRFATPTTSTPT